MKTRSKPEDDNMGNLLLADLRDLHRAELESAKERGKNPPDCILSKDLDKLLHNLEERPWGNWKNGKGISSTARGRLLNKYEIRTETLRVEQEKGNGYRARPGSVRRFGKAAPAISWTRAWSCIRSSAFRVPRFGRLSGRHR